MRLGTAATKVPFRNLKSKNAPAIRPPALLSLFSALCILSLIGTLIYAVIATLAGTIGYAVDPVEDIIVATVHFLLPILIAYSVSANSAWSRPLIAVYSAAVFGLTIFGVGYIAPLVQDSRYWSATALMLLALIALWLFGSPKMRIYYALIQGRPVPTSLADRAIEYVERPWPGRRMRVALDWATEHLETIVLLGMIATVFIAWLA